jgi:GxxExxY protein
MIARSDRVTERQENEIETLLVDRAVPLRHDLEPGLLETLYEVTWAATLRKRGWSVERWVSSSIESEGPRFDSGCRCDWIVERKKDGGTQVIENVDPAHRNQLLAYLHRTGMELGYLLNFGEAWMKDAITRIVSGE